MLNKKRMVLTVKKIDTTVKNIDTKPQLKCNYIPNILQR